MGKTNNTKAGRRKPKKFKRTVRLAPSKEPVSIDDILSRDNGNARQRFKELVDEGIPEALLKDALVSYANSSDKRLPLVEGMTRKDVTRLAADALELADKIERANKSPFTNPGTRTPLSPWPGRPFAPHFLELPTYLGYYALDIMAYWRKLPQDFFMSHHQELELVLIAMALYFIGTPKYAAFQDLLNAALGAANETQNGADQVSKPITRAALLHLVKDHPEDIALAKQELAQLGFPEKRPSR